MTTPKTRDGWLGLALDPLDVLLFRDGRSLEATAQVQSGLPTPDTLAGALHAAILRAYTKFDPARFSELRRKNGDLEAALRDSGTPEWVIQTRIRGPFLARLGADAMPLLPQPANLTPAEAGGGQFVRTRPIDPVPGFTHPHGLLPVWRDGKPESKAKARLFTLPAIGDFLKGATAFATDALVEPDTVFAYDGRTGIGIDPEAFTTGKGLIYGVRYLALAPGYGFYAEVLPGEGMPSNVDPFAGDGLPVSWGGKGRYALARRVEPVAWPAYDASRKRSLWYMATPACFKPGRPLPTTEKLSVKAAVSEAGIAVTGWDAARSAPRGTRFAVPAGAAYFANGPGPGDGVLIDDKRDGQLGWGFGLQGVWTE